MSRFEHKIALDQWEKFNQHMSAKLLGFTGYREYLPEYKGRWTPDSGPIVFGMGVAASGLALNAATSVGDVNGAKHLKASVGSVICLCRIIDHVPLLNKISRVGTDLLASSIYLNAITKVDWYIETSVRSCGLTVLSEH
jgi:hypothetical protein